MKQNYGYIYKTTNLVNGTIYIGKKVSAKFLGNQYLGSGNLIVAAIKKYGKENFNVEVLEWAYSRLELDALEICYISNYRQRGVRMYNIADGGEGGDIISRLSPEAYESWVEKHKKPRGISPNKGKKCMNKSGVRIKVRPEEIDSYICDGWKLGNGSYSSKPWNTGKTKEDDSRLAKMAENLKLKNQRGEIVRPKKINKSQAERERLSKLLKEYPIGIGNNSIRGRIWVTDGATNIPIENDKLDSYLQRGWKRGFTRQYVKPKYNANIVLCVTTGKKYKSESEAQKDTGISVYYIRKSYSKHIEVSGMLFEKCDSF